MSNVIACGLTYLTISIFMIFVAIYALVGIDEIVEKSEKRFADSVRRELRIEREYYRRHPNEAPTLPEEFKR